MYVSGGAGGTYRNNVQYKHAYCGFKVTKSCESVAIVENNVDKDSIERQEREEREAAEKERDRIEAKKLKLAAEQQDEERRLRKIYGNDWRRHSKLQPMRQSAKLNKNKVLSVYLSRQDNS